MLPRILFAAFLALPALAPIARAEDNNLPPFDFSDDFYRANGIDPAAVLGRPTGANASSVIDNRENGPNFNNVRILQQNAAYDHSGHPIFFSVTGLPSLASFLPNAAGQHALQVAETFYVYEFPRAANPDFAVFPKRQDLIADLRNGYFSHDPLGIWRVNIVRFTPAAFNTQRGRQALADLQRRNGVDLDGTPLIREVNEVEDLLDDGLVTIQVPAMDGSQGLRWFFCPVVEHPEGGAIAPDAFLTVVPVPSAHEHIDLFESLRAPQPNPCDPDMNCDGNADGYDVQCMERCIGGDFSDLCWDDPDFNHDGNLDGFDVQDIERAVGGEPCPN